MTQVALFTATLAALGVIVLIIRLLFLVRRVQKVWERIDRTVESELAPGIRAWGEAAQGVRQAAGKLDGSFSSLGGILERLERLSEKLDSGVLMGSALTKLSSWLSGVRRGMARPHQHSHARVKRAELDENQSEPRD